MSDLLLITSALEPSAEVLPALGLLLHPYPFEHLHRRKHCQR